MPSFLSGFQREAFEFLLGKINELRYDRKLTISTLILKKEHLENLSLVFGNLGLHKADGDDDE